MPSVCGILEARSLYLSGCFLGARVDGEDEYPAVREERQSPILLLQGGAFLTLQQVNANAVPNGSCSLTISRFGVFYMLFLFLL